MDDEIGFERGSDLMHRHLRDTTRPAEFTLLDREWELLDGVFSPTYTPVTGLFTSWLPFPPGGSFLEIGSGVGVAAVVAAQEGCAVTALDVSAAAVENTRRNVVRHGVADRVRVLHSDLFSALGPDERFDLIYWNSNFAEPPEGFVNESDLHHAFFDPGYDAHRRFLREAPDRLTPGGRVLLGFSSIGNVGLLRRLATDAGRKLTLWRSQPRELDTVALEFQMWELTRA
ncbi:methyltransferase [Streptomyces sp. MAR4 CNX-425]|uniref:methyltransferase n=1 Tax=Streptomyces sp. MAR4 CNX-425 TaxID=3406343 RepID=UPI003B514724